MNHLYHLNNRSHNRFILFVLLALMLFMQMGHLHMHNHKPGHDMSHTVHVVSVQDHSSSHDQNGEIDLQLQGLIAKVKIMPDLLPLAFFISLILAVFTHISQRHELIINFPRSLIFTLRPPSRASP